MPASYSVRRALSCATRATVSALALFAASAMRAAATPAPRVGAHAPVADARAPLHLRLERSAPASGATLEAAPTVIRLWFSLPPELAVTTIKLVDAGGKPVALAAPVRGRGPKDPVESAIQGTLTDGRYTVSWKTSSRDGHPMKGDFTFTVKTGAR